MKLNRPKDVTFLVAVILAILGVLGTLTAIPVVSGSALWFVFVGFIVLAAGNLMKGL